MCRPDSRRGERRYLSNRAAKRRVCFFIDECQGEFFHWDGEHHRRFDDKMYHQAKTQFPFTGDRRREREEWNDRKPAIKKNWREFDEVGD